METVLWGDYVIICNDSMKINDTPYNITLGRGVGISYFGNIFISKIVELPSHERDLGDLDDYDAQLIVESLTNTMNFEQVLAELAASDSVH